MCVSSADFLSVQCGPRGEICNLKLHDKAAVCSSFDLNGLADDSRFISVLGSLVVACVHNQSVYSGKFFPCGLYCNYLGIGYFAVAHGQVLATSSITVRVKFFLFKNLVSNPGAVRKCSGPLVFRSLCGLDSPSLQCAQVLLWYVVHWNYVLLQFAERMVCFSVF